MLTVKDLHLNDPLSLNVGLLHLLLGLSPHSQIQHFVAGRVSETPSLPRVLLVKIIALLKLLASVGGVLDSLQWLGLDTVREIQRARTTVLSASDGLAQPLVEVGVSRLERDGVVLDGWSVGSDDGDPPLGAGGVLSLGRDAGVDGSVGRSERRAVAVDTVDGGGGRGSVRVDVGRRGWEAGAPTPGLRALTSTHLNHALEVDIHRVRELERLQH